MEISAKTKAALLQQYVDFVDNKTFCYVEPEIKSQFHRESKKILRIVAQELGYQVGDYQIRVDKGRLATCGSITLYSSTLTVSIQGSTGYRGSIQISYGSTAKSGLRHSAPIQCLKDLKLFVRCLRSEAATSKVKAC